MLTKIKTPSFNSQFFKTTIARNNTSVIYMQNRTARYFKAKNLIASLNMVDRKQTRNLTENIRIKLNDIPALIPKNKITNLTHTEIIGTRFYTDIPEQSNLLLQQLNEVSLQSNYVNRIISLFAIMVAQEKCSIYMLGPEQEHKLFDIAPKCAGYCLFVEKNSSNNLISLRNNKDIDVLLHEMTHAVFYTHSLASIQTATLEQLGYSIEKLLAEDKNFRSLFNAYKADIELLETSQNIDVSEEHQRIQQKVIGALKKCLDAYPEIFWIDEIPPYYSTLAALWPDEILSDCLPHLYNWMDRVVGAICDEQIKKNPDIFTTYLTKEQNIENDADLTRFKIK